MGDSASRELFIGLQSKRDGVGDQVGIVVAGKRGTSRSQRIADLVDGEPADRAAVRHRQNREIEQSHTSSCQGIKQKLGKSYKNPILR